MSWQKVSKPKIAIGLLLVVRAARQKQSARRSCLQAARQPL
jgi:hypothetical protein